MNKLFKRKRIINGSLVFFLLIFTQLSLTACSKRRPLYYSYPTDEAIEVQRVCLLVLRRGTKKFAANNGNVILHIVGTGALLMKGERTSLKNEIYFCGRAEPKKLPCAIGTTRLLDGRSCSIEQQ